MKLEEITALVADEMASVNSLINDRLRSDVVLINELSRYIVHGGGKRIRPLLVILSAKACQYSGQHAILLATIVEFIHTATLLHDDVVDASEMRRGRETANHVWGNQASVLVGDFLYSRAFQMMVEVGNMRIMDILAHTTNTIAEGEVMQLLNAHNPDTTEEQYLSVILSKTAKLFEAACRLGAVVAGKSPEVEKALAAYGLHIGTAFQLIDDVLDYSADERQMGKNIGDDLSEGKPTLPLIHAIRAGTFAQAECVRSAIREGGLEAIGEVLEAIHHTGAIEYTKDIANSEMNKALASLKILPAGPFREALEALAYLSVNRTH